MGELQRIRVAVAGLFFINGFVMAAWVANIPAIQRATGLDHAVLGGLLLVLGAGAVVGMLGAGFLVDRLGSRGMTAIGMAILVVAVIPLGLVRDVWGLGVALFVFGVGNGTIDVSQNDQAVRIERRYGRPIMAGFHAFFSIGGAAGAGLSAILQASGLSVLWPLGLTAVIAALLGANCLPRLVGGAHAPAEPATATAVFPSNARRRSRGRIIAMALLAFFLMLSEGTANDWSALHAVEHLGQPAAAASLAYAAFAIAMTIGRLTADRIAQRFGPTAVVRAGSGIAGVGMLTVVLSPCYPLTLAGWIVFGLGLSGVVPQLFTAAGNIDPANQGIIISRVVGAGYVGLLAGPAVIGWLATIVGLTGALVLPVALCTVGVILAGQVTTPRDEGARSPDQVIPSRHRV